MRKGPRIGPFSQKLSGFEIDSGAIHLFQFTDLVGRDDTFLHQPVRQHRKEFTISPDDFLRSFELHRKDFLDLGGQFWITTTQLLGIVERFDFRIAKAAAETGLGFEDGGKRGGNIEIGTLA